MSLFTFVVAAGAGTIAGLLTHGLLPQFGLLTSVGVAVLVMLGVAAAPLMGVREEDSEPEIRHRRSRRRSDEESGSRT